MSANGRDINTVLNKVQALLNEGRAKDALELLSRCGSNSPPEQNARGVCLMRLGLTEKAIDLYRRLVLRKDSVCFRSDVPVVFKTNFATALLLSRNVSGCEAVLEELGNDSSPEVVKLRAALSRWRHSLNWVRRLLLALHGAPSRQSIPLDFPPGDL